MIKIFLIVVGCYVLAGFLVHAVYRLKRHRQHSAKHYVLLASRQHSNMERMIRSFFSFSRWMGIDVQLTVVDAGLSEQTREIIQRLNRTAGGVNLYVERFDGSELRPMPLKEGRANEPELQQHLNKHRQEEEEWSSEAKKGLVEPESSNASKGGRKKQEQAASSLLWRLQADGVVTKNEYPVVIDLQNPEDLSKIPF
ncbi:hypothetical protein SAMN04487969_13217 [Paenibacillus algorifonticola]|uniref:Uncharacterized protein n=1 Tax=Paenibacillus algorifonticola TaxID=684063 RepID=A0A1I2I8M9_9BACL|nr:hypothetical protein [Paenibacillus algorifonticola]SFF38682.1 hypothetical protein SAMN04487969_13217 [Paenibacillus algorifonticola]